jgi:hypothetical protein
MSKKSFDLDAVRQRLAARRIHPAREPNEFQCAAEIIGLTPNNVGYDCFAAILYRLQRTAAVIAGGDYAISVVRDPRTHERRGYIVHTNDQTTADEIAATIRSYLP